MGCPWSRETAGRRSGRPLGASFPLSPGPNERWQTAAPPHLAIVEIADLLVIVVRDLARRRHRGRSGAIQARGRLGQPTEASRPSRKAHASGNGNHTPQLTGEASPGTGRARFCSSGAVFLFSCPPQHNTSGILPHSLKTRARFRRLCCLAWTRGAENVQLCESTAAAGLEDPGPCCGAREE